MIQVVFRPGLMLFAVVVVGGCRDNVGKPSGTVKSPATQDGPSAHWFTEITTDVGLDFVHETGATGQYYFPEIMGAGAALFDYDGDGDLDIYLTNGVPDRDAGATHNRPGNRLYRQGTGGTFVEVPGAAGLDDDGYGMGVAVGDFDNDGDLDVYVANYGSDRLYRNNGNGEFDDVSEETGIQVNGWSSSVTFYDYDGDGFLDLYVARYVRYDPEKLCRDAAGRPEYCGPSSFPPLHDVLLRNNGGATFTDVSEVAGIASVSAPGLGVVCEDFNDDTLPDIYVANDGAANQLWINQGDGTFRDDAMIMGVALNSFGLAEAGMGLVAADFDNDADPDLFMTHLRAETNTLYRNLGGRMGFDDIAGSSGLGAPSVGLTGFGTAALDLELDGDLDLLVVNGAVIRRDTLTDNDLEPPWRQYAEPNLCFLNDGTAHFESVGPLLGSFCERAEITRGLAIGDIDSDGDLDVLINNVQGQARLYRNDTPRQGHWLMVRAVYPKWHRDAIGARVTVLCGEQRRVRSINGGFGYLSASPAIAHFGLGNASIVDTIIVRWPDGSRESFPSTSVDRQIVLERGTGSSD